MNLVEVKYKFKCKKNRNYRRKDNKFKKFEIYSKNQKVIVSKLINF